MIKTLIRLSDGRELIFYDEHQRDRTSLADGRGLPEVSISSEIRHDPILDEWVVIASHRQTRTFLPPADECPLCPSRGDLQTEIPAADYDLVVFENRFPSLTTAAMLPREDIAVDPDLVMRGAGFGRCEVVVFTSDHDVQFSELPVARIRNVVDVW
ncbi:MAG: galactose-1-phosphate uridylyltransferase, partial [Acidimicrobiia bacterium]|nr:galactose-1-phosphate uridylyltransferase [Acidimicrobiia bacterium]